MPEPRAYYNEKDKFAATWLRNLIAAGSIVPGDVDERDIRDVRPDDLRGYRQCHFFAGVWSYALRRAGWPDRRPVWTASCPCQPFSAAGKGEGFDDERHLWPAFFHLVEQRGPRELFGEQVASKDGLAWLDLVQSDMEGAGYAFGALDICAAGFGAPHIRQRLYWAANAPGIGRRQIGADDFWRAGGSREEGRPAGLTSSSSLIKLAYDDERRRAPRREGRETLGHGATARPDSCAGGVADDDDDRLQGRTVETLFGAGWREEGNAARRCGASLAGHNAPTGPVNGIWRNVDWLLCRDGKWRPVRSGTFPLAHGAPSRVGRLRAYGNAIVAPQAEEFIGAYLGTEHLRLNDVFA